MDALKFIKFVFLIEPTALSFLTLWPVHLLMTLCLYKIVSTFKYNRSKIVTFYRDILVILIQNYQAEQQRFSCDYNFQISIFDYFSHKNFTFEEILKDLYRELKFCLSELKLFAYLKENDYFACSSEVHLSKLILLYSDLYFRHLHHLRICLNSK